jgi:polyhydroxyalkanoate synthase
MRLLSELENQAAGGMMDSDDVNGQPHTLDRMLHAAMGRVTGAVSPPSVALAYLDWGVHFYSSPAKWAQLLVKARRKLLRYGLYSAQASMNPETEPCIEPLPQDYRFRAPEWQQWPFNLYYTGFLLTQQWWHNATTSVRGVSKHHEQVVEFGTRQILDMFSPSNCPLTNPEVLKTTIEQNGANLGRGFFNCVEDVERELAHMEPSGTENFRVGDNVAVTPGKVVYRNQLVEVIQYEPTTETVHKEPILFIPAWIMKYYILDLSPHNSMVKYLVDRGHTVFMVSWKNPDAGDAYLGMSDYRRYGIMAPLDVVSTIVPTRKVHAVGYCLGGTLLSIAAAAMGRDGDDRLASVTLLATQTDFAEAGELTLFIDESQVAFLQDIMWDQGYLDTKQMAGAFQLLRSNDLIWSRMVRDYMLGDRRPLSDLMDWNADPTRMPFRMHSEYLERMFLKNELANGQYEVEGRPVSISNIRPPMFVVSTQKDHVAPWRSVYKIHLQADAPITFVLTSGGHNAGIISEPGHPRRHYRVATHGDAEPYLDPDTWFDTTPIKEGSWWPEWEFWLRTKSTPDLVEPPGVGGNGYPFLCDAPGTYVLAK